jgi:hypothetical protein
MLPNAAQPKKRFVKKSKKTAKKPSLTSKVDHLMKVVNKQKPEYKYYATAIGSTPITEFGTNFDNTIVTNIVNGSTDNQRIGEEIRGQNLTLRYNVIASAAAKVRVICFIDKQDYFSGTGAMANLLEPWDSTTPAPNNVNCFYSDDVKRLKRVLYDKVHVLTSGGGLEQSVITNIRLNNLLIGYRSDNACIKNKIQIGYISDQPSGGATCTVLGHMRLSFTDD